METEFNKRQDDERLDEIEELLDTLSLTIQKRIELAELRAEYAIQNKDLISEEEIEAVKAQIKKLQERSKELEEKTGLLVKHTKSIIAESKLQREYSQQDRNDRRPGQQSIVQHIYSWRPKDK